MGNTKKQSLEDRKESLVVQIKAQVDSYLLHCNQENTPYLCKYQNQDGAVEKIYNFVLQAMFKQSMTIGEALSEKERVLDPNYLND